MLRFAFLSLCLAASVVAAPPTILVTNDGQRSTLTYSYDAANVADLPPPVGQVDAWADTDHPNIVVLGVPAEVHTRRHGSVSVLEPTTGMVTIIGYHYARKALLEGKQPPSLTKGITTPVIAKLEEQYDEAVAESIAIIQTRSTPTSAAAALLSAMPQE